VLLWLPALVHASVIGIDFGSTFMKVALVQLKVPLEIVPNTISKRKTEIAVAFDRGERMVGNDAFGHLSRKPMFSFAHFREMLGRSIDHPLVKAQEALRFGVTPIFNESHGGIAFTLNEENTFTAEELTAMMFTYARDTVKDFGGQAVRDCVITVPSFATAHERRALTTAAEIAGLKVLALIEENTAAALQYGKDNVFEDKTVLYYNMGASATQVLIANYNNYTVKELGKNKTIGTFDVKAKTWDMTLGGEQFDIVLMEHFADKFNEKWGAAAKGDDIRSKVRPMQKLRAQATKTKHVLSANTEIPVKVNSLHDDVDLSFLITRKDFEGMVTPLLERVTTPIQEALDFAGLTVADLDAVELIGGAQRIPKIQSILGDFFGDHPLGVHLNADEAPALGAAFEAANLSTAFKVRKTGMTDYSHFPVEVKLRSIANADGGGILGGLFGGGKKDEAAEEEAMQWGKQTVMFPAWSKLDAKKKIAFHHDHDISCEVSYAPVEEGGVALPEGTPTLLQSFNITGIAKFAKEQEDKGTCGGNENSKPKIHLTFKLDAGAIVRLAKAEATCEEPKPVENATDATEAVVDASAESTDSNATSEETAASPEAEATDDASEEQTEDAPKAEGDSDAASTNSTESEDADSKKDGKKKSKKDKAEKKEKKSKKEKKKDLVHTANLVIDEQFTDAAVVAVSPPEVQTSKDKLAYLQELADLRRAKLEAKNTLEAYLYEVKNRVDDEAQTVDQVTTEEQREELLELARQYIDWLDDDGYDVETEIYIEKKGDVKKLATPIFFRATELEARPKAVTMMTDKIAKIRTLVAKWEKDMPQVTEIEREDVLALADKVMAWVDDKKAAQDALELSVEPAFTSSEATAQLDAIGKLVTRLARKPKPKPKPVVNATNSTNSTNATEPVANATDAADAPSGDGEEAPKETESESADDGEASTSEEAAGDAGGAAGDDEL
jgi:hypoxia up-regulated 1